MASERAVLVVEDHAGIRESLVGLLEDEGYRAVGVCNGSEALRRLEAWRPALILMDLMMPVMNGVDLSARLRSDPALAQIPIVVVTASRRSDSDGIPAVGWLQKPFDIAELLSVVKKYLDG